MKKLLILLLVFTIASCNKETIELNTDQNQELTQELLLKSKARPSNAVYDQVEANRTSASKQLSCTVDPDDFEECEVTFKVLCIDDCGENVWEDGEVWVTFEYYTFEPNNPSNTAYVKNNWGSQAGGPLNLQIGQEYTLQHPVIVSEDCPMYIWGEMWSCCFSCIPWCPLNELDAVAGTIYLEINGAVYYPVKVWNLPHCEVISVLDPNIPNNLEHFQTHYLDENCYVSDRVDFVQDPCGQSF